MASFTRSGTAFACIAILLVVAANVVAPTATRSYVPAQYALEMDGASVGFLQGFSGCRPRSEVLVTTASDGTVEKQLAPTSYEPCVLTFANNMGKPVYEWIQSAFEHRATSRELQIVAVDYNFNELSRIALTAAYITVIEFPPLDAMSKDRAYISLEVRSGAVRSVPTTSAVVAPSSGAPPSWAEAGFRVELGKVAQPAISWVGPVVLRIPPPTASAPRDVTKVAGVAAPDDINVTIATTEAVAFTSWADEFLVQGKDEASNERTMRLSYLSADRLKTLFVITLTGVGIHGGDVYLPRASATSTDTVARSTFELYAEQASLVATPGGVA